MSKFENLKTGVVVSVEDSKDDRFDAGWKSAESPKSTSRAKKSE